MRRRIVIWSVLVFAATLFSFALLGNDASQSDQEAVNKLILAQIGSGRSADGQLIPENSTARRLLTGSGATPGSHWVAVQYTIKTGLIWQTYVAVLTEKNHQLLVRGRVGGKGYRNVSLNGVSDVVLKFEVQYYGPEDVLCCPSVEGTSSFEVRDR
jgi:hypothetical protein